MKLFLDTNIFMDMLFEREHGIYAKQIIQLIQNGKHDGCVADITLLNIDYIAKKQRKDVRHFLYFIEKNFVVVGADNRDIYNALRLDNSDLEDNVQVMLAKKLACDLIISNDKNFVSGHLPILDGKLFLSKYSIN